MPFSNIFKIAQFCYAFVTVFKRKQWLFWGDQSDQTEHLMPSFTVASKETLDCSWGSVEVGLLMMQVLVQSTCTFSHLSPWNKYFHFPAKLVPKWEAAQDVPHEDLLLSECGIVVVDTNHLHLSFSCYCCFCQGGRFFVIIFMFFNSLENKYSAALG